MSIFLSFKLRKASNTDAIEKRRDKLQREFEAHQAFRNSEKLQNYKDLETEVTSSAFKERRKSIERKKYKTSLLYKEEKELKKLEKAKNIKTYFKVKNSSDFEIYNRMEASSELKEFLELKQGVETKRINKKDTPEDWDRYQQLKQNGNLNQYFKFENSKDFQVYNSTKNSSELARLQNLRERINSDDFKKEKAYLLDKKRYEKSEDFKKLQEFEAMKKSEEFINFFKNEKKNPFTALEEWELTFADEFNDSKLDTEKWATNYYWGDKLLGDNYSNDNDLNAFTSNNVTVKNSLVQLNVKKESRQGVAWNLKLGFVPREFGYTSGIISSGKSFKQKYGKFEAKIKVGNPKQLQNVFWLVAQESTPHIDILKTNNGKLFAGNYWSNNQNINKQKFRIKGVDLSKGYFIYTLEWNAKEIIWKINDVVVKTQTSGVPQEPMFLNFAVLVKEKNSSIGEMSIDWIRCYQKK